MPSCSEAENPFGINIVFNESNHSYKSIIDNKEINYISGTTFLNNFIPKFDPNDDIARRVADRRGITVEQIKSEWAEIAKNATILGTKVHETIEDTLLKKEYRNNPENEKEKIMFSMAKKIGKRFLETIDILGVEKIVFDHRIKIAGTIDLFAKSKTSEDTYIIIDHKTNNKPITEENTYNKFLLEPISHIPDNNFYHYALQLNLYEYLLKSAKYVNKNSKFQLFLNHITEKEHKFIKLPNLQNEIKDLIIWYLIKNAG